MIKNILIILLILISPASSAKTSKGHVYFEKDYQKYWCDKYCGAMEVILPDNTRADCVTHTHAIEFDFAKKWAESVGQALYYGEILNKKPGIVLIVENKEKEQKYVNRVRTLTQKYGITLWLMYPEDLMRPQSLSEL